MDRDEGTLRGGNRRGGGAGTGPREGRGGDPVRGSPAPARGDAAPVRGSAALPAVLGSARGDGRLPHLGQVPPLLHAPGALRGSGRSASHPPTTVAAKSCGETASNDRIRLTGAARGRVRLIWCSIEKQPVARCADERPACDSGLGSRRVRPAAWGALAAAAMSASASAGPSELFDTPESRGYRPADGVRPTHRASLHAVAEQASEVSLLPWNLDPVAAAPQAPWPLRRSGPPRGLRAG